MLDQCLVAACFLWWIPVALIGIAIDGRSHP